MSQRNMKVSLKPGKSRAALTITHPNAANRAEETLRTSLWQSGTRRC